MKSIKKQFETWTKLDYAWLIIANTIIVGLSLFWGEGIIPIISAMTGVSCVIFVSKGMMLNYIVGAVNVGLYAFLAYQSKLYGDVMLNALYYFPMQFIGLYMWSKAKPTSDGEVESKKLTAEQRFKLLVISVVSIAIYSRILATIGGNIPLIDATSTVLSVIAMLLMVKQYLEQWYLWVVVNVVSIIMWAVSLSQGTGDYATLLMWIIYLLNSLYGLYNWTKANKEQAK